MSVFFKLNGTQNTYNIRYWAAENPHHFVERSLNATGVMVFMGITSYGPIGPFFFDELETNALSSKKNSVSGPSYKELLIKKVIPELQEMFPPDILSQLIFQLDGAPGHTSALVRNCLNKYFPRKWMGNKGPLHWAPRSPDLTPLGSFFIFLPYLDYV